MRLLDRRREQGRHSLAYMLDNRDYEGWPDFLTDLANDSRVAVMEMGEWSIDAMAAHETVDPRSTRQWPSPRPSRPCEGHNGARA
jgi:hypothetical protein